MSRRASRSSGCGSFFQGEPVTFSEEAFLTQKPGSPLQAFHQRAVHLQLFKQVRQSPKGGAGAGGVRLGTQTPGACGLESVWPDLPLQVGEAGLNLGS